MNENEKIINGISICVDEKGRFIIPKQIRDAYTFLTDKQLEKQMLMFNYDLESPDEIKIKIIKKEKR